MLEKCPLCTSEELPTNPILHVGVEFRRNCSGIEVDIVVGARDSSEIFIII